MASDISFQSSFTPCILFILKETEALTDDLLFKILRKVSNDIGSNT